MSWVRFDWHPSLGGRGQVLFASHGLTLLVDGLEMPPISRSVGVALALVSFWRPARHAHLGIAVVAVAMIAFGRFAPGQEIGPGYQNHILVGLLLLMFAIVPNQASRPPIWWYQETGGRSGQA